jgi:uncharacterized metal-binding protein
MPSGKTHLRIEAGLLFGWTALAGYLLAERAVTVEIVVAFTLAYAFSMLLLSPDLDLARSRASRRWRIARILWIPYALIFRHRGVSHHPLFGPATRITYLGVVLALVVAAIVVGIGVPLRIVPPSTGPLLGALAGFYAPNLTHVVADRVASGRRRKRARSRL